MNLHIYNIHTFTSFPVSQAQLVTCTLSTHSKFTHILHNLGIKNDIQFYSGYKGIEEGDFKHNLLFNFSNILSKVKFKPKSLLEINFKNYRHSEKNSQAYLFYKSVYFIYKNIKKILTPRPPNPTSFKIGPRTSSFCFNIYKTWIILHCFKLSSLDSFRKR